MRPALPPPRASARLILRMAPEHLALFRFLLEGYDNLAYFTVLERRPILLKLVFSPHRHTAVRRALAEIASILPFSLHEDPFAACTQGGAGPHEAVITHKQL